MNIKKATIVGVLQDWDMNDYRVDIERVCIDVPLEALESFTDDEIMSMVDDGCDYSMYDGYPLEKLLFIGIEDGWFKYSSRWELEDPCELKLEIEEEA